MITVLAGKYAGKQLTCADGYGTVEPQLILFKGFFGGQEDLTPKIVKIEKIESADQLAAGGALVRGMLGSALFGPAGLLLGLTARKVKGLFLIDWDDGEQSLVEVTGGDVRCLTRLLLIGHGYAAGNAETKTDEKSR